MSNKKHPSHHSSKTNAPHSSRLSKVQADKTPQTPSRITARLLSEAEREDALYKVFGKFFISVEMAIYSFMSHSCPDYHGAYWEFYALSNNGFFMAPSAEYFPEGLTMEINSNGFKDTVSSEAAGIISNLFTYCYFTTSAKEKIQHRFTEHFYQLRDYALEHKESQQILSAID